MFDNAIRVIVKIHLNCFFAQATAGMSTSDFGWMSLDQDGVNSPRKRPGKEKATAGAARQADVPGAVNGGRTAGHSSNAALLGELSVVSGEGGGDRYERRREGHTNAVMSSHENCNADGVSGGYGAVSHGSSGVVNGKATHKRNSRQRVQVQGKGTARRRERETGAGDKGSGRRRVCPPSELAKRAQLLEALVLWTFKDVIVPLVSPPVCPMSPSMSNA